MTYVQSLTAARDKYEAGIRALDQLINGCRRPRFDKLSKEEQLDLKEQLDLYLKLCAVFDRRLARGLEDRVERYPDHDEPD